MSIRKPEDNNNGGTMSDAFARAGVSAESVAQPAAAGASRGARAAGGRSTAPIMDINNRLRRPISRNASGEIVQGFQRALKKQFDIDMSSTFQDDFSIHVLDNNTNMISLSAILVCMTRRHQDKDHLAVFTLVVEGSGSRLNSRFVNINGQNVEIDSTAGDVVDRTLWDRISVFLEETYGRKLNLHNAGAMVLPVELSYEDESHMHRIAYTASQALYTVLENDVVAIEPPISASMVDNGASLMAVVDYNPGDTDNAVGLPIRNDLSIILRGMMNNTQQSLHEQVRDLTVVSGFVDLVWAPPQPTQMVFGQPMVNQTQHYAPRFVLTQLDSQVDALTPELALLALSTSTLASKNMAWGGVFLPRYITGTDLRDIGAIGYEIQFDPNSPPTRLDTRSDTFGKQQLFQLLTSSVHDALIYSMDIDEVGELSWLHQMFITAASDPGAYKAVVVAADRLTDGHFSRIWNNGPIANDDMNRIHLGYYTDSTGRRRDLRDIDYLAMLNLMGSKDMQVVVNWSRTFDDVQLPLELRLEQRAKILKGLLTDVKFKGYARRITFHPQFILALNQACENAGLVIRPSNMIADFSGQTGRGAYNVQAYGVNSTQLGNLFNYTQPGIGGYRGIGGPFYGRTFG